MKTRNKRKKTEYKKMETAASESSNGESNVEPKNGNVSVGSHQMSFALLVVTLIPKKSTTYLEFIFARIFELLVDIYQ